MVHTQGVSMSSSEDCGGCEQGEGCRDVVVSTADGQDYLLWALF